MKTDVMKEMTQEETKGLVLLPCPFCGSPGVALSREYTTESKLRDSSGRFADYKLVGAKTRRKKERVNGQVIEREVTYYTLSCKRYTVCCSNKACIARKTTTAIHDIRDAAARWNRRA